MGAAPGEGRPAEIEPPSARDHLANERTLLAWVRTALTVVGLGFIVDRLVVLDAAAQLEAYLGIALVAVGGIIAAAGGWSYVRARREMLSGRYQPSIGLHLVLVGAVVLGSVIVAFFLLTSRPLTG